LAVPEQARAAHAADGETAVVQQGGEAVQVEVDDVAADGAAVAKLVDRRAAAAVFRQIAGGDSSG